MKIFVIVATLLAVAMAAVAVALLLTRSRSGVEIHMDDRTQVRLSKSVRGVRVEFVADDDPDRPADSELMPSDPVPEDIPRDSSSMDREFIRRLAAFESSSADDKEAIVGMLLAKGLISRDEAREWLSEPSEDDGMYPSPDDVPDTGNGSPDAAGDVYDGYDDEGPVPGYVVDEDDGFGGF